MVSLNNTNFPLVVNNHISVQVAASYSGYCTQCLRRLLRNGKLEGLKIGQLWLADKGSFDSFLRETHEATDQRFGPR
jgi:hypothetical protein